MPKKTTKASALAKPEGLRIGAVSRLTRIPVDTLRAWERRYGVVAPSRELSAVRLYHHDDVGRLARIKRLVDSGHAIGSVANLSCAELEAMLALHSSPALAQADSRDLIDATQVVCFSDSATPMEPGLVERESVTVLGVYRSWAAFETAVMQHLPQALVIDMPALIPERVDEILRLFWRSAVARVIVCYAFSPAALVSRLEAEGVIALQSPVSRSQIVRELRRPASHVSDARTATHQDPAPRRFDDAALVEMARLSSSVACECPGHLVGIIRTLNEFEFYSATCEHRHPDDAAVHAMLRASTGNARAAMERALIEVANLEGLPLPASTRTA